MRFAFAVFVAAASCLSLAAPGTDAEVRGADAPQTQPAQPVTDKTLVLDERTYVRPYYEWDWDRISPGPLKQAAEKDFMDPGDLRTLERDTKARLAFLKPDWDKIDWRDAAVLRFVCPNAGIQPAPAVEKFANAPPPPVDWAAVDFDDADWPRDRKPFLWGRPILGFGVQNIGVRACYYRTRFDVPDPAAAGDLTLDIEYRGGVRIFVNGTEVARGHLPAYPAGADPRDLKGIERYTSSVGTPEDYPYEAYVRAMEEFDEKDRQRIAEAIAGKQGRWPSQQMLIPELWGRFEDAPHPHNRPEIAECHRGTNSVSRTTWQRIQPLRDRRLSGVKVPSRLLRQGVNVLAIEVRAARLHPIIFRSWLGWGNYSWAHAQVNRVVLRADSGNVPTMLNRPGGVQVWTPDVHHRLHDTEWASPDGKTELRIAGGRAGTYSAQLAVGTDRELKNVRAVAGELKGPDGASIPASAVEISAMKAHDLMELSGLVGGRSKTVSDPLAGGERALIKHGLLDVSRLTREQRVAALEKVRFFDHVTDRPAANVPAGRCGAWWVRLNVPADAPAGTYRGTVTVSGEGPAPVQVPVSAHVFAWPVPRPKDFRTLMALEQSPYGVAKQYNVQPWSEEHYRLLAESLKLLGRAGNDWLFVPVLSYTELGNRTDSPIRWVRRKDGSIGYDTSRLDRYLDLAAEHMGAPRVICFVVMHGNPGNPPEVMVYDESGGPGQPMSVAGSELTGEQRRAIWGPFAVSLYAHMKSRGLAESMFWGYAWDSEGDPTLKDVLEEFTPEVRWAMGGHELRTHPRYYTAYSWIYKVYSSLSLMANGMGWRNEKLEFQNPRGGGSVLCLPGNAAPFGFRMTADRALTAGARGVGRIGADYWKESYYDAARGGEVFLQPGMNTHVLFWPGPGGAQSSGRYEALVEGLQECEARIFLEQMLIRKVLPEALAAKVEKALEEHLASTLYIPAGVTAERFFEYARSTWRQRSARLYAAAAEVASTVGLDVDADKIAVNVPPRSPRTISLTIRNWTMKPRRWIVTSDKPWLKVAQTSDNPSLPGGQTNPSLPGGQTNPSLSGGAISALGNQTLNVTIDPGTLKPGESATGALTVTDKTSGIAYPVAVTARVAEVFKLSVEGIVLNAPVGGSDGRELTVLNTSGKELEFAATSEAAWVKASPASGKLAPDAGLLVRLTAGPPVGAPSESDAKVTFTETPGEVARTVAVKTFVIPPYREPAEPKGAPVPMEAIETERLVKHAIMDHGVDLAGGEWMRSNDANKPKIAESMYYGWHITGPKIADDVPRATKALWVRPHHETVYKLDGAGFTAFAATVGVPKLNDNPQLHRDARVIFEIHADGKMVANSGIMSVGDKPRRLVATGLDKARQIKLVTRLDSLKDSPRSLFFWAEPTFYKKP